MFIFRNKSTYAVLLTILFLSGCTDKITTESVLDRFNNANISDVLFSYTYEYESDNQNYMSDYIDLGTYSEYEEKQDIEINDPWYEFYQMAETVFVSIQEGLSSDMIINEKAETNESQLIFMYRLDDGAQIYIYEDGCVKTIDADRNRTIYDSNDQTKQAVAAAKSVLLEHTGLMDQYSDNSEE